MSFTLSRIVSAGSSVITQSGSSSARIPIARSA